MVSDHDPEKSARNVALPGRADLPFGEADDFDFETAIEREDTRLHPATGRPYRERRYVAIGKLGSRIVVLVYTPKPAPVGFRTISLRRASRKERRAWRDAQSSTG